MTTQARTRNVPTWRMTRDELARVWAAHHGIAGRTGGWLYDPAGVPVCHGYAALGRLLERQGIAVVGVGIDWMRAHRLGVRVAGRGGRRG